MLDAENHVVQQTSLRTHRLMDQCDVVPKVVKALHWRVAASSECNHSDNKGGPTGSFFSVLGYWKSHLSHGTGSLWPSSALLPLLGHTPWRTGAAPLSHAGPGSLNSALGK